MTLAIGALLGFISVAFGAYAEHGLKPTLSEHAFASLSIALRYNQTHAIVIVMLGLIKLQPGRLAHSPALCWAAVCFIAGTILFSFSLYASALFAAPGLNFFAPLGGTLLMLAWLLLVLTGLRASASIK